MGDNTDAPAAVTAGELAAVLQAMDEKYRSLFDAISKQAGSSKSEIELKEEVHPLQMPHVKLEGSETYVSWAEHAETILVSRKLEGYILGTIEKPAEESSKEAQRWRTANALVRAWLLSSLSPQIAKQVERIKEAAEIWRLLKSTYSGVGNEMLACKIQKELQDLCQGDKSVVEYVSELKRLWSDLDYYDPIELECGKCVEKFNQWTEKRRVRDFLNGLNPKFENRRAALYGSEKLPSLEQAISAIISEETRLRLESTGFGTQGMAQRRSALVAMDGNYQRTGMNVLERKCFECGQPGHLKAFCPELLNVGRGRGQDWRGRGRGRSFDGRGGTRARGARSASKANASNFVEEVNRTVNVEMNTDEWKKWCQIKEMSLGDKQYMEGPSTPASSALANFGGKNLDTECYNHCKASWLIDSGASRHMAGNHEVFSSYVPEKREQIVKLADGSSQIILGSGTVMCSPDMSLSSVLHVPSFPINLLSISCITKELNCAAIFFPSWCIFQELGTGRRLGTGRMHDGLYYLDNNTSPTVAAVISSSPHEEFVLLHRRLGHMSFAILGQLYPNLYNKIRKDRLVCDACQYGKQTRSSYVPSDNRSDVPLQIIHSDVWGPSRVVAINGYRYFVTFIDCCTRTTWLYVLRNKSDVFECFKDFHNLIMTQHNACVKVLRTDNGTEYVNREFDEYLSSYGIIHQTTCPGTSEQNGLAERKNRHLLEITRCIMLSMNVPKFLWSEAVMTAAYLMNRMPTRALGYKTPIECLVGETKYVVPPKVFGCVCFVKDYRPSVGKLDPKALKCIFVGYSGKQKGYKCWCPSERRMFVSMDVVFREHEPFYGEPTDLSDAFPDLFTNDALDAECKTGGDKSDENNEEADRKIIVGVIPTSEGENTLEAERGQTQGELQSTQNRESRWPQPNEEHNLQVYSRRNQREKEHVLEEETGLARQDSEVLEQEQPDLPNSSSPLMSPASEGTPSLPYDDLNIPIAHRKPLRSTAGKLPSKLSPYNVTNHVSYACIGPSYKSFIAALDSTDSIPHNWQEAKQHPKWWAAMVEEMEALDKNNTWVITKLPANKKVVGCKWVFTIKQTPEGKVERYKARLVAKGYSQTYGVDYDETFAPVAKMNTIRAIISIAANCGWNLFQMDVKNAFLHGDLQEEVYMEIPPGFNSRETEGKVCKLMKSLYGLKQSPRAWFGRFSKEVCSLGYRQSNADHTLFFKHCNNKITVLVVYVDDIIITGNDDGEMKCLKETLAKTFEVKDLGYLHYFLGIEVAYSAQGIYLSQRKYILDLLTETGMLDCKPAATPIEQNHRIVADLGDPVDKSKYQRLVGRLIYLSHTRPDISYAVSIVSRYMHDPRSSHMDAVNRILRYLKYCPGKGIIFSNNKHMRIEGYTDADWAGCLDDRRSTSGYCIFFGGNLVSWRSKKQSVVARSTAEAELRSMASGLCELMWLKILLTELQLHDGSPLQLYCDNQATINVVNNPVHHDRTKHIGIDRHFIKERLEDGTLHISFVKSSDQLADVLTKGVNVVLFNKLCNKMGLIDIFAPS
jgi:transposase InsO family protein